MGFPQGFTGAAEGFHRAQLGPLQNFFIELLTFSLWKKYQLCVILHNLVIILFIIYIYGIVYNIFEKYMYD